MADKTVDKFKLIVIGTGPAASRVAKTCAEEGWRVAVIESREFGGTCALRGCNPKKVFVRAAELVDWAKRADGKLARCGNIHIDWSELVEFKNSFTEPVKQSSEQGYVAHGIHTFHGKARFIDRRTIGVGDSTLEADSIVIASGATPASLDFPGNEHVITSDKFMDLQSLPPKIVFLGGGYISFEFSHVAARAGSSVTILERGPRPLKQFDPDLVQQLTTHSQKLGIDVAVNADVEEISEDDASGLTVRANVEGKESSFTADLVVHGAGRVPNLAGMNLEAGGIESNAGGVVVNRFLQSVSNEHVFSAGDCAATGRPKLTPTANQEARTIVQNLLAGELKHEPDYGFVPAALFTVPSLACVGLSEAEADKQGKAFETQSGEMADWGSVRKVCESCAAYKILIEKESDQILGAHLLGPQAAETINLFALAMKFGLKAADLKSVLFTFPTFAADVRSMI